MKHELSLGDQIARAERRIEARRERTVHHYEVTKAEVGERVAKVLSWWPLAAVAGSLAIGVVVARMRRHARHVHEAPVRAAVARPTAAKGILASVVAIAATAMRIAGSHELRTFLNAFRAFRARRHARTY